MTIPSRGATRRSVIKTALLLGASMGVARAATPIRIGVLNDFSGGYSDITGRASLEAVRMAVEDAGGAASGQPIQVLNSDHQNKTDIGIGTARRWYDEGVDVIVDFGHSSIALGVQALARERNKLAIFTTASSTALAGSACSPNGIQWSPDNYSNSAPLVRALLNEKLDSFFFITADYTFGHDLEALAKAAIAEGGGSAVGGVRSPLGASDFSSFLLAAQASGAKVIVLALVGADLSTCIKQAREFGLTQAQRLATPTTYLSDIHALGPSVANGLLFLQSWYWDLNDDTRAFAKRFHSRIGRMPNDNHAALYSAIRHFIQSVAVVGTTDGRAVAENMKARPINDVFTSKGSIRKDGRVIFDRYLVSAKSPEETARAWDYLKVVSKIDGAKAFRPMSEGGCPLTAG